MGYVIEARRLANYGGQEVYVTLGVCSEGRVSSFYQTSAGLGGDGVIAAETRKIAEREAIRSAQRRIDEIRRNL